MKIYMTENEGCFAFDMTAETMADAALLARFSNNVTNEVRSATTNAHKDGTFTGYCVLGKRRRADSCIARAR
mgnify:CR=1 FL=1